MLDALTQRLSSVVKTLRGHARLTDDNVQEMLREVRLALLDADAGLPVVKDFVGHVKERALGQDVVGSLTPGQALVGVVYQELVGLMGGQSAGLDLATQPPAVILLEGRYPNAVRKALASRGYRLEILEDWSMVVGGGQGVLFREDGWMQGGGDPRRNSYALGW